MTSLDALVGVPYRAGGTDPATGLGCAGLVAEAYRRLGRPVPPGLRERPTAADLEALYRWFDPDDAPHRPGRLVVFADEQHVGIEIEGGRVLHAAHRGVEIMPSRVARRFATGRFRLRDQPAPPDRSSEPVRTLIAALAGAPSYAP